MWQSFIAGIMPDEAFYSKTDFIIKIAVILLVIKLIGEITKRFGQPSVFGKLLVGIILGPSVLGFIPNEGDFWHTLKELSEVGVIMLMFLAGLETDVREFKKSARGAFWVAVLGVVVPLFAGYAFTVFFGYKWTTALFVGTILVATSVSISVQTLRELHHLQTREGFTILGAAVIDDILGLVVLSLIVGIESGTGQGLTSVLWVIVKAAIFFAIAFPLGRVLFKPLFNKLQDFSVTKPILTGAIVLAFIYAVGAEFFGLAGIVGAYTAGILLAVTPFKNEIIGELETIAYSFFVPIFFVSVGVTADLRGMSLGLLSFSILLTIIAILTKIIGCGAGAMLSKFNLRGALRVGIGMVARGEVALIVATYGLDHKIIDGTIYAAVVFVAILTTVVTPPLLRLAFTEKGVQYD